MRDSIGRELPTFCTTTFCRSHDCDARIKVHSPESCAFRYTAARPFLVLCSSTSASGISRCCCCDSCGRRALLCSHGRRTGRNFIPAARRRILRPPGAGEGAAEARRERRPANQPRHHRAHGSCGPLHTAAERIQPAEQEQRPGEGGGVRCGVLARREGRAGVLPQKRCDWAG